LRCGSSSRSRPSSRNVSVEEAKPEQRQGETIKIETHGGG
jgi:hypothetical protein